MDSDSQESPRREQDWGESPLAKEPLKKLLQHGLGDWRITTFAFHRFQCTEEKHHKVRKDHWTFLPEPQNTQRITTHQHHCFIPQLPCHQSCPKQSVLPPAPGMAGHRTRATRPTHRALDMCSSLQPDHLKTKVCSFLFSTLTKKQLSETVFKQIARNSYQGK